jgi:hypothetical protein
MGINGLGGEDGLEGTDLLAHVVGYGLALPGMTLLIVGGKREIVTNRESWVEGLSSCALPMMALYVCAGHGLAPLLTIGVSATVLGLQTMVLFAGPKTYCRKYVP